MISNVELTEAFMARYPFQHVKDREKPRIFRLLVALLQGIETLLYGEMQQLWIEMRLLEGLSRFCSYNDKLAERVKNVLMLYAVRCPQRVE